MRKLIQMILLITIIFQLSIVNANKDDEIRTMADSMIKLMKHSGDLNENASCIGVSESKFETVYHKVLSDCMSKHGLLFVDSTEKAMANCIEKRFKQDINISDSVFNRCDEAENESDYYETENEYNYHELPDKAFDKQTIADQQVGVKILDAMRTMSKNTENLITLPIYSPSEIMSHAKDGMSNSAGKVTLPIAMFRTSRKVNEVAAFYEKELPEFKLHINEITNVFTFMREIPKDFDKLSLDQENLPLYFIPHIAIYSTFDDKTAVSITYKR